MNTKNSIREHGFTIVELLVVAPIVILVIGVFVSAIVNMTGQILSVRTSNSLAYNIQDALNRIEQDVKNSGAFLATNNIVLTSPQGYNDDTTNFHNVNATNDKTLILNSYATTTDPLKSSLDIVYASGQPNPCGSSQINKNNPVMVNIIYFVKNGTLWRRTLAPANYSTIGCSTPWQQPSCAPGVAGAFCKTQDVRLVDGINNVDGFVVNYYPDATSAVANTIANDNSKTDSVRLAALRTTKSATIEINATSTQSGRSVSQYGAIKATSQNSNISSGSNVIAPTIISQPQNKTALTSDTNVTFTAAASGTNPTVKWQQSTDQGVTWTDVAGATSTTLTLATVNNTMDGYKYHAIFTNSQGQITSSNALLTVNLLSWTALTLQNSWSNYNGGYHTAGYMKTSDGVVTVKGLIQRAGSPVASEVIGVLPVGYRPSEALIFTIATHPNTSARVDVYPNGEIRYMSGSNLWISLDTIHFIPDTGRYTRTYASTFYNSWGNYGNPFAKASYAVDNSGRVIMQGVVGYGTWTDPTPIFSLPTNLLPLNYMNVPVASATYGSIGIGNTTSSTAINARVGSSWLSTQVIYYPTGYGAWSNLTLKNGWVNYGDVYTTPQVTRGNDRLVSLKGHIKSGTATDGTIIATLSAGYRPSATVLYSAVSNLAFSRIDIDASGNIIFKCGSNVWISLDGITFYADQ